MTRRPERFKIIAAAAAEPRRPVPAGDARVLWAGLAQAAARAPGRAAQCDGQGAGQGPVPPGQRAVHASGQLGDALRHAGCRCGSGLSDGHAAASSPARAQGRRGKPDPFCRAGRAARGIPPPGLAGRGQTAESLVVTPKRPGRSPAGPARKLPAAMRWPGRRSASAGPWVPGWACGHRSRTGPMRGHSPRWGYCRCRRTGPRGGSSGR
jgi:hypothetical protein